LETRQLGQIDRAPQPPGDEPREVDPADLRHSGPPADGRQLSDGAKYERACRLTAGRGDDVARQAPPLANCMLRGGRMESTAPVRYERAVSERPHARPTGHRQGLVDAHAAALARARQSIEQRMWGRTGGPDDGAGREMRAVAQAHLIRRDLLDTRARPNLD